MATAPNLLSGEGYPHSSVKVQQPDRISGHSPPDPISVTRRNRRCSIGSSIAIRGLLHCDFVRMYSVLMSANVFNARGTCDGQGYAS